MKPIIGLTCSTSEETGVGAAPRFHCAEAYVRRVEEAGGVPILLPTTEPSRVPELVALLDGVILIGGDDVDPAAYGAAPHPALGRVDPARDAFELALSRHAAASGVPALGICRGHQVMNVALGGTLVQDIPAEIAGALAHAAPHDARHDAAVAPGTRLARLLGVPRVAVNSHHHQAVRDEAPGFPASARTSDGVVEASEIPGHAFFLGVQWHPERMPGSDATRRLFDGLLAAASVRQAASARALRAPAGEVRASRPPAAEPGGGRPPSAAAAPSARGDVSPARLSGRPGDASR